MNALHTEVNGGGRRDTVAACPARCRRWRRLGVAIRTPQPEDPWPWRVSRHGGARGTCSHLRRGPGGLRGWWALAALQPDSTVCSSVARMFRRSGSSCAAGTCAPPGRHSAGLLQHPGWSSPCLVASHGATSAPRRFGRRQCGCPDATTRRCPDEQGVGVTGADHPGDCRALMRPQVVVGIPGPLRPGPRLRAIGR